MMEPIRNFLKHWPRTVLLMLLGAVCGLLCWMYLPRTYTASARLTVGLNYNRTGTLDDLEQDRILGVTEDILHSDKVMEQVFNASSSKDYAAFYARTHITRTNETWSLEITGTDPEETGRLAAFWMNNARQTLEDALKHAVLAEAYQNRLEGLTRCVQSASAADAFAVCDAAPEELQENISRYAELIRAEEDASYGLSTAIQLGPDNDKQIGLKLSSRSAAADTLIGAFCGLLAAFAIAWIPEHREQA